MPESWSAQASEKAERLNAEGRHNAAACLAATREVGLPQPSVGELPNQVGMIAYVNSPDSLQRFSGVLREWRENLHDFGHHGVTFRLCDDSPEPYATQIRGLLAQQPKDSVRFEYLGAEQKAHLRERLQQGLSSQLSPQDAAQVAALMAGPGATQNRNLSLQLLGRQGGLQMDHDMTPEVLCTHWEDPIPFDILGSLQGKGEEYGIRSYSFTGAHDVSIDHILAGGESLAPRRIRNKAEGFMGNQVRGPMFVSKNIPSAARIAPGLRDGDLALSKLSEKVTTFSSGGLSEAIYHRDQAGGRWYGGELLRQYLLYEFCTKAVSAWVGSSDEGAPEKVGRALLQGLEQHPTLSTVQDSSCFERSQSALKKYCDRLPLGHPEHERIREQLCLRDNQEMDSVSLDASLHQEARGLLRTQALALIHSRQIEEILGRSQDLIQRF